MLIRSLACFLAYLLPCSLARFQSYLLTCLLTYQRIDVLDRDLQAKRHHRLAEFLLGDLPIAVGVPVPAHHRVYKVSAPIPGKYGTVRDHGLFGGCPVLSTLKGWVG